jgi:hypothetical protein
MKKFVTAIISILIGLVFLSAEAKNNPSYSDYFKARDEMIRKMDEIEKKVDEVMSRIRMKDHESLLEFESRELEKEKKKANLDSAEVALKDMLQKIIGPTNIVGFEKSPELCLFGANKDDGQMTNFLRFFSDSSGEMLVTTKMLFDNSKKIFRDDKKHEFKASEARSIASGLFECASKEYSKLPIKSSDESYEVHASIGICAQDIGPFPPSELIISVVKNEKMITIFKDLGDEIEQISACEDKYNQAISGQTLSSKEEEKLFEDYIKCFAENAKNQKFYPRILSKAQATVDSIIASENRWLLKE